MRRKFSTVYCLLFTAHCFLLPALCLLNAAPAPQGVLSPLKVVELPLPPGERNVASLYQTSDNRIGGLITGRLMRTFAYDSQSGRIEMSNPIEILKESDIQKLRVESRYFYAFDEKGALWLMKPGEPRRLLGQVSGTRPFEKEGYQVSRALVLDADGNVYTAGKDGFIFRYSPKTEKLEQLNARLPAVQGREAWASLDAAVLGPDGLIYGGTFDGYIFTFNPKTLEVVNLGKPLRQQRIQGLAFSKSKLYGVGGEEDGLPRAFAFDPKTRGFELGGTLKTTDGKIILDPVGAMGADKDGNIYIGTMGRLGNLYVWEVR
jgi:outer membrane protein assembly factor BamB